MATPNATPPSSPTPSSLAATPAPIATTPSIVLAFPSSGTLTYDTHGNLGMLKDVFVAAITSWPLVVAVIFLVILCRFPEELRELMRGMTKFGPFERTPQIPVTVPPREPPVPAQTGIQYTVEEAIAKPHAQAAPNAAGAEQPEPLHPQQSGPLDEAQRWRSAYFFSEIAGQMYQSQYDFLEALEGRTRTREDVVHFLSKARKTSFEAASTALMQETWLYFLERSGLITEKAHSLVGYYEITDVGRAFLAYMRHLPDSRRSLRAG